MKKRTNSYMCIVLPWEVLVVLSFCKVVRFIRTSFFYDSSYANELFKDFPKPLDQHPWSPLSLVELVGVNERRKWGSGEKRTWNRCIRSNHRSGIGPMRSTDGFTRDIRRSFGRASVWTLSVHALADAWSRRSYRSHLRIGPEVTDCPTDGWTEWAQPNFRYSDFSPFDPNFGPFPRGPPKVI